MSALIHSIEIVKDHLDLVAQGRTGLKNELIQAVTNQFQFATGEDLLVANQDSTAQALLPSILAVLRQDSSSDSDVDTIGALLDAILRNKPFDDVLRFFSVDDLTAALQSSITALQTICLRVIKNARPADLIANTPLVEQLVRSALDSQSEVSQQVLATIIFLAGEGQLVRRRLFNDKSVYSLLIDVVRGDDTVLQGRVMDLVIGVMPFVDERTVPWDLVAYSPSLLDEDGDILFAVNLIQFYTDLVKGEHPESLLEHISDQVMAILALLKNEDTLDFLKTSAQEFFGALSRSEPAYFRTLDESNGIVDDIMQHTQLKFLPEDVKFIHYLNPEYLATVRPELVARVPITHYTLPALSTLYSNEQSYRINPPSSEKLMSLEYPETIYLIMILSQYSWSVKDVVTMPQVMTKLLESADIRETQSVKFRREAIENLLDQPTEVLGPWRGGLQVEHKRILYGVVGDRGVDVATQSGQ